MKKRMLATVMALSAFCMAGCGESGGSSAKIEKDIEVWSTYNTAKVIRQTTKNAKYAQLPAKLSVQMMKGEYEGAQLIITSNVGAEYTLAKGELKNANGTVIPAENIHIYHQKYVEISRNYNGNPAYNAGDAIPDMLLPMDIAVQYGENFVKADSNQGITVEFDSEGLEAGVYTGDFLLEIAAKSKIFPSA